MTDVKYELERIVKEVIGGGKDCPMEYWDKIFIQRLAQAILNAGFVRLEDVDPLSL